MLEILISIVIIGLCVPLFYFIQLKTLDYAKIIEDQNTTNEIIMNIYRTFNEYPDSISQLLQLLNYTREGKEEGEQIVILKPSIYFVHYKMAEYNWLEVYIDGKVAYTWRRIMAAPSY